MVRPLNLEGGSAESSAGHLSLFSYQQMERKGRQWVAAEIQCAGCERRVTRASGEDPEGQLSGVEAGEGGAWSGPRAWGQRGQREWEQLGWRLLG